MFILSAQFYNHYLFHIFYSFAAYLPSFNTLSMCLYYVYNMPIQPFILKHSISNLNINLWEILNIKTLFNTHKINVKLLGT